MGGSENHLSSTAFTTMMLIAVKLVPMSTATDNPTKAERAPSRAKPAKRTLLDEADEVMAHSSFCLSCSKKRGFPVSTGSRLATLSAPPLCTVRTSVADPGESSLVKLLIATSSSEPAAGRLRTLPTRTLPRCRARQTPSPATRHPDPRRPRKSRRRRGAIRRRASSRSRGLG